MTGIGCRALRLHSAVKGLCSRLYHRHACRMGRTLVGQKRHPHQTALPAWRSQSFRRILHSDDARQKHRLFTTDFVFSRNSCASESVRKPSRTSRRPPQFWHLRYALARLSVCRSFGSQTQLSSCAWRKSFSGIGLAHLLCSDLGSGFAFLHHSGTFLSPVLPQTRQTSALTEQPLTISYKPRPGFSQVGVCVGWTYAFLMV